MSWIAVIAVATVLAIGLGIGVIYRAYWQLGRALDEDGVRSPLPFDDVDDNR
ncbi:MAG: hypothetical protein AB7P20_11500 [Rhizobiaceae bacterium]